MTELYVAGRDAHVAGAIQAGQVKPVGLYRPPEYTRDDDAPAGQTVAAYRATLARLAGYAPGAVSRKPN